MPFATNVVNPVFATNVGDILLTKQQERAVKRIQEESLKIQENYIKSPYLKLNDENWKEMQGSVNAHCVSERSAWFFACTLCYGKVI